MRGIAGWDVVKTWAYVAGTICLGAVLAPYVFNAGMALAEVTEAKRTNSVVDRLGDLFRALEFRRYFQISLLGAALVLFAPWWASLGGPPTHDPSKEPARPSPRGRGGAWQALAGLGFASGLFLLLGVALLHAGSFVWREPPATGLRVLAVALAMAIASAGVQELFFRGAVLTVFLRGARPMVAIAMNAVLFAAVHFLISPAADADVADEEARAAGFEWLGNALTRVADPMALAIVVLPLLGLGAVLGHARWRTGSLWLPAGLHAGWIFVAAAFPMVAVPVTRADPLAGMLVGPTPTSGLIPFAAIVSTGLLIGLFTTHPDARSRPSGK